jgi:hypothetical protein
LHCGIAATLAKSVHPQGVGAVQQRAARLRVPIDRRVGATVLAYVTPANRIPLRRDGR